MSQKEGKEAINYYQQANKLLKEGIEDKLYNKESIRIYNYISKYN